MQYKTFEIVFSWPRSCTFLHAALFAPAEQSVILLQMPMGAMVGSSSVRFSTRFVFSVFFIVQFCFSAVGECRVDGGRPRPRKDVEFMGEGAGDGCVLCEELVLCCPQFTITLDSSAFTGPLPSLTIPTGTCTPHPHHHHFPFISCRVVI